MKAMNNSSHVATIGKRSGSGGRSKKQGSPVTEARAHAQRAKLDTQVEAQQAQQAATRKTPQKKTGRQEMQARRYAIDALIEAYIQDHIGGNHSEKTLE